MKVYTLTFSPFEINTYIVTDDSKECVIIDPGCFNVAEERTLSDFISEKGLKPVRLINTHCHLDHVFGNNYVTDTYGLKSESSEEEQFILNAVKTSAQRYGINMEQPYPAGNILSDKNTVAFGNSELKILHAPGHTLGSLVYYSLEDKFAIVGDVLFKESIGRTDLPGGNHAQLIESIKTKLFKLPDDTIVYPGHMQATTIGYEKKHNPYLR